MSLGDGHQSWFAVMQWFKPSSVVEQAVVDGRFIAPKRTKNVNDLQVAVVRWELALVEHESKFAGGRQRDNSCDESHVSQGCSRGSSTDLSILKNFEIACLDVCERSWLDKMRTVELNPWTMGKSTNPKEGRRCQCSSTAPPLA